VRAIRARLHIGQHRAQRIPQRPLTQTNVNCGQGCTRGHEVI
jgi:hypothetical protein